MKKLFGRERIPDRASKFSGISASYEEAITLSFAISTLAAIVFVLYFTPIIKKVHDYYLFPLISPVIVFISAEGLRKVRQLKLLTDKQFKVFLALFCTATVLQANLRMNHRWQEEHPGFNPDLLKYRDLLRNAVPDTALCIAGVDKYCFTYFYYINKKGWCVCEESKDSMRKYNFEEWIRKGARFLYSDSRNLDSQFLPHIDTLVLKAGSINVFRLKVPHS